MIEPERTRLLRHDRPYLGGIRYPIITERGTRLAALQAGQLDVSIPLEMTKLMAETAKKNAPALVVTEIAQNGSDNVILNHKRPPFDKVAIRRAVSLALDRHGFVQGVRQGGAFVGPALMSPPFGAWGLPDKEVRTLPGYRAAAQDKAEAKRLLAAAGVSGTALKVDLVTRNFAIYIDLASFVVDQLKQVGIEAAVRQVDTAAWFPTLARREFQIGANLTAGVVDDPDAYFFENYKCGSPRTTPTIATSRSTASSTRSRRSSTARSECGSSGTSSASSRPTWPDRCWAGARSTSPSGRT